MNLCSEKHEEVCYDCFKCPACNVISDLEDTITELGKELETSEKEVLRLENKE